jgi:hypothetical protein
MPRICACKVMRCGRNNIDQKNLPVFSQPRRLFMKEISNRNHHESIRTITEDRSIMRVHTYFENSDSADLTPKGKPKLLFKANLSHGPGFDEITGFYLGPNDDSTYDVLWIESDWTEELTAIAWVEHGAIPSNDLSSALLKTYWQREKEESNSEEPSFSEIMKSDRAVLPSEKVRAILEEVWPGF